MGKYLKTKPNSLESAVLEAVSPAQQAAIAIAKKEKGEKPKNEKTECPQCEGKGCDHCDGKGYHEEVSEKMNFSDKEVKMAIGIASDPRYKGGNYSGAVKTIEKIKKGLSDHPQVKAVLKRQNENKEVDEGSKEEYEKFFKAALKKFGVESPADFKSDEEKKKFFDYIDKNYEGEGEKSEEVKEAYGRVKKGHYDVKVTVSDKDVAAVKKYILNSRPYNNGDIEDVDSDQVDGGGNKFKGTGDIFIQGDGAGDLGVELAKKFGSKIKVVGESVSNPYVDAAAKHISTMWKEAAKVKKEEDEPKKKEDSKTTMTGKPMSGVQVNPLGKE